MKLLFILAAFLPIHTMAQKAPVKTSKPKVKVAVTSKVAKEVIPAKPADGYVVYGTVTGLPDGTSVAFANEQTGMLDEKTRLLKGKFSFTGKVAQPELKQLYFGTAYQPIQLFLDNSSIKIETDIANINKATVSGSPTHKLFADLVNQIGPIQQKLSFESETYDTASRNSIKAIIKDFVQNNNSSFVAPVALVILNNTAADEEQLIDQLYNGLTPEVKNSAYGNYLGEQVRAAKKIPIGVELANFTQADSTGKDISLTSFRGKYLLIDFWASWCRPCRQENPNVVAAYNKYSNKNFTILGVSFDQTKPAWINAIAQDNLTWAHVSDLKGWGNAVGAQFGIQSIPQNLLIGPDGRVIGKNLRGKDLVRKLNAVLN